MRVIGWIVRRRCIGKKIAFADVQVEESEDSYHVGTVIQVAFLRDSPSWNKEFDGTFPARPSALPYGGKVSLDLYKEKQQQQADERSIPYEVLSWQLLLNPKDVAMEVAQQVDSEGTSLSQYLKVRADTFSRFNQKPSYPLESEDKKAVAKKLLVASTVAVSEDNLSFDGCHGDNRAKALRAKIFASWLLGTYGKEYLKQNQGGVLDIAGGKGKLSVELALQGRIPCTILDPMIRRHGKKLLPREVKQIKKANAPHPNHIAKPFNRTTFLDDYAEVLNRVNILVGLHPDECTEDILDVALQYDKPFAIVPCCVFSGLFPVRMLRCGTPVRTYEQFLQYLLNKDPRLRLESLGFEGKNKVIYFKKG